MISSFGMSCIRSFEYTVGPIDPDPDDERTFLEEVSEAAR